MKSRHSYIIPPNNTCQNQPSWHPKLFLLKLTLLQLDMAEGVHYPNTRLHLLYGNNNPRQYQSSQTVAVECGLCLDCILTFRSWVVLCDKIYNYYNPRPCDALQFQRRPVSACIFQMLCCVNHLMTTLENCQEYDQSFWSVYFVLLSKCSFSCIYSSRQFGPLDFCSMVSVN